MIMNAFLQSNVQKLIVCEFSSKALELVGEQWEM